MIAARTTAPLDGHLAHILLLTAWIPIFALVLLYERLKQRRATHDSAGIDGNTRSGGGQDTSWRQMMAVASICAAIPHIAVAPDHFRESLWYGAFFVLAASSQLGLAGSVLIRPTRIIVRAGIAGSMLIVVLWLITRTSGVPIGPGRGETEPYGLLDGISSLAEACTVVFGVLALRSWSGAPAWRWVLWRGALRAATPICITLASLACALGTRS